MTTFAPLASMQGDAALRRAATMPGRRLAVLSASHPFLFCPERAGPGMVKLFTDAAAFRAWCATPEAAGHVLSVRFHDGEELVHAFFDPTTEGLHVRAIVAAARFFASGAHPERDEGPGPGAAARHAALWAIIDADFALGNARLNVKCGIPDFARDDLRKVVKLAEQAAALLWQPGEAVK